MAHKCFISFKTEDLKYKKYIQDSLNIDIIDKSLNTPINSFVEDYIMRVIRRDYLSDSTVTIHLIGTESSENNNYQNQNFIKRELQASLYNGHNNTKNGILGVVTPDMYDKIFEGDYNCSECGNVHRIVNINDTTVVKEFSYNYYIPKGSGCGWEDDERYCILVKWEDFIQQPEMYIEKAFEKRSSTISSKTKVKP